MADALRAFWHSPLGRRVARARTTYREMPFLLRLDGTEIAGTADLLLEDADGRWELVDYKSGRPEADRAAKAAEPYRLQLGLYALAASRRIGRAIDRWTVYFLGSAVTHEHSLAARDLEEAERDAKRAISDMAAGRFDAGNRQTCPTCRFRPVCGG
jgi:RecB family exonuclease